LSVEQANRARQPGRQRHKQGAPKAQALCVAGGGLVGTTLAPAVLSAQTIMALSRGRWQVERAIQRWQSVLELDA
jgi:predicted glycosyltransferase